MSVAEVYWLRQMFPVEVNLMPAVALCTNVLPLMEAVRM